MRKLTMMAAMLAMMLVAASPAMASEFGDDGGDSNLLTYALLSNDNGGLFGGGGDNGLAALALLGGGNGGLFGGGGDSNLLTYALLANDNGGLSGGGDGNGLAALALLGGGEDDDSEFNTLEVPYGGYQASVSAPVFSSFSIH